MEEGGPEISAFNGFEIAYSREHWFLKRKNYLVLDLLGDMGGFFDAIYLIGYVLIQPVATYLLDSKLLSKLFRFRHSNEFDDTKSVNRAQTINTRKRRFKERNFGSSIDELKDEQLLASLRQDF